MELRSLEPQQEIDRLAALHNLNILDSPKEAVFDTLTALAASICETPISLVSFVARKRQWFKSCHGVAIEETPRSESFCQYTIHAGSILEVPNALEDQRFAELPPVTTLGIRFYVGIPLRNPEGHALGTICVLDTRPRTLTEGQRDSLKALALHAESAIAQRSLLRVLKEQKIALAQEVSQREELTHFLLHDLRGPLTLIVGNADFLQRQATNDEVREVSQEIQAAAAAIDGMATQTLGSAATSNSEVQEVSDRLADIQLVLAPVLAEMRRSYPMVEIDVKLDATRVQADPTLIQRIIRNLVLNAANHAPGSPIRIATRKMQGWVEIEVADYGPGVPAQLREKIFENFNRRPESPGHGLGLAFCKRTATEHNGRIWVEDNPPSGARFLVRIPHRESVWRESALPD